MRLKKLLICLLSMFMLCACTVQIGNVDNGQESESCSDLSEDSINESITHVEKYILNNGLKDNGLYEVDNIFKYVIPKDIYILQDEKRKVAILCNYKFDMEHGLAIVFENEKFKTIVAQDIIL